ncbi:alpha/beta hydrolase [Tenacibaculum geojense]|uniref:Alpha/beta hydrolase n=1 Tax=Tenacibaculum geojense TaxID=915352 RepID=A0ABW3JSN6_9FLAO
MTHNQQTITVKNIPIYIQNWLPENPQAIVIVAHGMGEHSGRYEKTVAANFYNNDIGVVAFDHIGHGKSGGKRGHNPGYETVLDVIEAVLNVTKQIAADKPVFIYGHSMGGNAIINYILKRKPAIKGAIASSPFLKLAFQPPKWKLAAGKLLLNIAPSITMGNELNPNDISRDPEEVIKYQEDDLVHDKISPNYSITFIENGQWAINNAYTLHIPMYVFHGTDDKIIDYKGSETFANNTEKASLKLYKGGYHELHNDICKKEVLADMLTWVKSNL